jgi:hypothetical protein
MERIRRVWYCHEPADPGCPFTGCYRMISGRHLLNASSRILTDPEQTFTAITEFGVGSPGVRRQSQKLTPSRNLTWCRSKFVKSSAPPSTAVVPQACMFQAAESQN